MGIFDKIIIERGGIIKSIFLKMKKALVIIFSLLVIGASWFIVQQALKEPAELPKSQVGDLSSIILKNTNFREFKTGFFSFKYPDWQQLELDPTLFLPRDIALKEQILLYLTSSDGVKLLATKREVEVEYLEKPYPLVLRQVFTKNQEALKKQGGLEEWYLIRERFFESGVLVESQVVTFGTPITSMQKSIIVYENNSRFIYSVGVSAQENIFEDYRSSVEFIMNSVRYY